MSERGLGGSSNNIPARVQYSLAVLGASFYLFANFNNGSVDHHMHSSREVAAVTNVATGKSAVQSSTLKNFSASLAIDGDPNTFSHTNDENAWLEIDLEEAYHIHTVKLLNRWCRDPEDSSGCLCRLSGAKLSLTNSHNVVATEMIGDTCSLCEVVVNFDSLDSSVQKFKIESTTGKQISLFEVGILSSDATSSSKKSEPVGQDAVHKMQNLNIAPKHNATIDTNPTTSQNNVTDSSVDNSIGTTISSSKVNVSINDTVTAAHAETEPHIEFEISRPATYTSLDNAISATTTEPHQNDMEITNKVSEDFKLCHANIVPNPVCKRLSCQQKIPPGEVARLKGHRGLTEMIHWQGCMLAYLLIPKSGSTTVRMTLRNNAPNTEMIYLTPKDNKYNPYTFTFLRDPGERIASAYSTIMARFDGSFTHMAPRNDIHKFPAAPRNISDISAWTEHFKESIHLAMATVKRVGWGNIKWQWNEHVPLQKEFMRGVNFAYIGCIESMEDALKGLGLNITLPLDESNTYQHSDGMPKEKFGSFDVLDDETKALVREVYKEDYELYESTCKK
jgi:hypothetical protein